MDLIEAQHWSIDSFSSETDASLSPKNYYFILVVSSYDAWIHSSRSVAGLQRIPRVGPTRTIDLKGACSATVRQRRRPTKLYFPGEELLHLLWITSLQITLLDRVEDLKHYLYILLFPAHDLSCRPPFLFSSSPLFILSEGEGSLGRTAQVGIRRVDRRVGTRRSTIVVRYGNRAQKQCSANCRKY